MLLRFLSLLFPTVPVPRAVVVRLPARVRQRHSALLCYRRD